MNEEFGKKNIKIYQKSSEHKKLLAKNKKKRKINQINESNIGNRF